MQIAGQDAELPEIRRRARFFGIFVMLAFLAIAGRLFYLQVIEGDTFYRLTSDNIIRTDPLPAVRGQIRDRKNRVLATVRPSYNLYVSPRQLTSDGFAKLRGALGMSAEQAVEVWERIRGERARGDGAGRAQRASGAAGRGHLARGDGGDRDRPRRARREDRLGAAARVSVRRARRRTCSAT